MYISGPGRFEGPTPDTEFRDLAICLMTCKERTSMYKISDSLYETYEVRFEIHKANITLCMCIDFKQLSNTRSGLLHQCSFSLRGYGVPLSNLDDVLSFSAYTPAMAK